MAMKGFEPKDNDTFNYVVECGNSDRTIYRLGDLVVIGCFKGDAEVAKKRIKNEYKGKKKKKYLKAVDQLMDGEKTVSQMVTEYLELDWVDELDEYLELISRYYPMYFDALVKAKIDAVDANIRSETSDYDELFVSEMRNVATDVFNDTSAYDQVVIDGLGISKCPNVILKRNPDTWPLVLKIHAASEVIEHIVIQTSEYDEFILEEGKMTARLALIEQGRKLDELLKLDIKELLIPILKETRVYDPAYYDHSDIGVRLTIGENNPSYYRYYATDPTIQIRKMVASKTSLHDDILIRSDDKGIWDIIVNRTRKYDDLCKQKFSEYTEPSYLPDLLTGLTFPLSTALHHPGIQRTGRLRKRRAVSTVVNSKYSIKLNSPIIGRGLSHWWGTL